MLVTGYFGLTGQRQMQRLEKKLEVEIAAKAKELFPYSLDTEILLGEEEVLSDSITLSLHGSGANKEHGRDIKSNSYLQGPVMIFNFPDHDISDWDTYDFVHSAFGTIDELLPVLFLLKQCLDNGITKISVHGFSAGGGVLVNVLAVLNSDGYADEFERIGIKHSDRQQMISALRAGIIMLDCPLRSIGELIDLRGETEDLTILAKKYRENNMIPIDRLEGLQGLGLNILLYFKDNDEVFSNRDENLYAERLNTYNASGQTTVIRGPSGQHNDPSLPLWEHYRDMVGECKTIPGLGGE